MRNWTPAVPIAAALATSAALFNGLPTAVRLDLHTIMPLIPQGDVDAMPRAVAAVLLPAIAALVWGFLKWLGNVKAPKPGLLPEWLASEKTDAHAVARFTSTYNTILFGIVAGVCLMHIAILGAVIGWPLWTFKCIAAAVGAITVGVGNVVPRTRPNWLAGIRTKATLSSAEVWIRTHRLLGRFIMVTGGMVMVVSAFSVQGAAMMWIGGVLLSMVAAHLGGMSARGTMVVVALMGLVSTQASAQARVDTIAPRGVIEETTIIRTADITLLATIAMPETMSTAIPVVVMVAGSGPTDRNGNGPLVQSNTYAQIAWGLAQHGIASIRYDKRGIGVTGPMIDHTKLSIDDYASDVKLAVALMRTDKRFSRVYALGHSEGAMLVVIAANRGAAVDGVMMLSGQGRPLSTLVHDQLKLQTDSATLAKVELAWGKFIRGEDPGEVPAIAKSLIVMPYRTMLQSMAAYDPLAALAQLKVPLMIAQGGKDWQVTMEDANALRAAKPKATWLVIPEATHAFKAATSSSPADQVASYHDKGIPIVPALVPALVAFVKLGM